MKNPCRSLLLCIPSTWLFLCCIFDNKLVIVSKAFSWVLWIILANIKLIYSSQSEIWVLFLFPLHKPSSKPVISTIYAFWSPTIQENRWWFPGGGKLLLIQTSVFPLRRENKLLWGMEVWETIQYSVMTYMKEDSKNEWIYVCITDSLCCTLETNTALLISYTPIKI